jgi:coenzyme PQQ precursor peptide PqqA
MPSDALGARTVGGDIMAWTTPIIVEICASFEVTAYAPAEM